MSFRTVAITKRCKLDYKMGFLEVRKEDTKRILLDDIHTLIIENPEVSLTGCLIEALMQKKIKVIFCDSKRNPQSELIPYYGCHDCSSKIKLQMSWSEELKGEIWTRIVKEKIRKQAEFLADLQKEEETLLRGYIEELEYRDVTNREGHAAKVYFNALFGKEFTRNDDNPVNAALNYGYSLILSTINREVVANGYLTQLGFFHDNMFNQFNLSCDLIEPFRVLVDRYVYASGFTEFSTEEKHKMLELLQQEIGINNTRQVLNNGIKIYVKSIFDAINEKDLSLITFYGL